MRWSRLLPPLVPALALMGAGALWWTAGGTPAELRGIALNEPCPLPTFRLGNGEGEALEREDLLGQWHFVYFGYTHCPDVCPPTLARLGELADLLPAGEAGYLFVSVDPARDDPAQLAEYTDYFHERLQGYTGTRAGIDRLVAAAGAHYRLGEGADYTVDHSAGVFLVGPEARVRAVLPPPHRPAEMAELFRDVQKYSP
ncbi:protein SCO1/2 [Thiohalospira halophila DSM 15071]|uniref:Protein SCO1/2 n=1 Tax=Thiohalospira halophila DSM 15071 TaxID=1123397 RepID=A0A1I1TJN5_9GAMM|nr:SCO family protein [Thiohalospira halophila]SFD58846.1 protein SCO1/2 [Thiohalospira halophila DSM 15071]